jgi:cell division protein FtsB
VKSTSEDHTPGPSYRSFLGVGVVFLLLFLATAGYKSWRDLAMARAHVEDLESRIEATQGRISELQELIERVESDPLTLERLAREDLGLVRPGDVVIVFPEEDVADSRAAP